MTARPADGEYVAAFTAAYAREFGFTLDRAVIVDDVRVRGVGRSRPLAPAEGDAPDPGVASVAGTEPPRLTRPRINAVSPLLLPKHPSINRRVCDTLRITPQRTPDPPHPTANSTPHIRPPHPTPACNPPPLLRPRPGPLPSPAVVTSTFFAATGRVDTPVYTLGSLMPRHVVKGPALLIDNISTVLVEPGWTAYMTADQRLMNVRM
eukprot:222123-Chlamydomonas_euryale.AAC.1